MQAVPAPARALPASAKARASALKPPADKIRAKPASVSDGARIWNPPFVWERGCLLEISPMITSVAIWNTVDACQVSTRGPCGSFGANTFVRSAQNVQLQ